MGVKILWCAWSVVLNTAPHPIKRGADVKQSHSVCASPGAVGGVAAPVRGGLSGLCCGFGAEAIYVGDKLAFVFVGPPFFV